MRSLKRKISRIFHWPVTLDHTTSFGPFETSFIRRRLQALRAPANQWNQAYESIFLLLVVNRRYVVTCVLKCAKQSKL
jgi:hypothetical protein